MVSAAPSGFDPADALAQFAFVIQGLIERRAAAEKLSLTQVRLLGVLRDRTPTMNELGRMLELDKSSVSGLVDRAERRGLVARTPSEGDRRAVRVRLSSAGRELADAASAAYAADAEALLSLLPPNDGLALLGAIGRLLVAHAEAHGVDLFAEAQRPAGAVSRGGGLSRG